MIVYFVDMHHFATNPHHARTSTPPRPKPRSKGFSLIEILVTVAIIGVLASLAFPTLSNFTRKGNTTRALANLKQIGVTTVLFANDNDTRLPVSKSTADGIWMKQLWPYAYPDTEFPSFSPTDGPEKFKNTIFYTPNVEKNTGKVVRAFGWNYILEAYNERNRLSTYDANSQACLVADSTSSSSLSSEQINFRNDGKAAVLFLDGHVALVGREDVPTTNVGPFWRGVRD